MENSDGKELAQNNDSETNSLRLLAHAFGGTFAEQHKPIRKPYFCKRATKPTQE